MQHQITCDKSLTTGERILRRYLSLPKYLDLLRTQSLRFTRGDGFEDRHEGAMSPAMRRAYDEGFKAGTVHMGADEFYLRARTGTYVSCWSLGAKDNMALWQLYGGAATSVAVTTTIDRLCRAASRWPADVHIRQVRYVEHAKNPDMIVGSYSDLLELKHVAYKFEREVRMIVPKQGPDWKNNPPSLAFDVNLTELVRTVVVAPEAGAWFYDLVKDATSRYGLPCKVNRSALTDLP